jgi:tRNA uridine 5-carboxymethylaminomethyl modification enzyme
VSLIPRPEIGLRDILEADEELSEKVNAISKHREDLEQVEIQIKYAGYIEKEFEMVREISEQEDKLIPEQIQYDNLKSLSTEGRQKLKKVMPETLGQAGRISGVSASDVAVLAIYLKS